MGRGEVRFSVPEISAGTRAPGCDSCAGRCLLVVVRRVVRGIVGRVEIVVVA